MNFCEYKNSIGSVLKEIYREDKFLRGKAILHIKKKVADKIKKQGKHISLPGQSPGIVTGNLLDGLHTKNKKTVGLVGFVAPAHHACMLEFGTGRMLARPILVPTFAEELETLKSIMGEQRLI